MTGTGTGKRSAAGFTAKVAPDAIRGEQTVAQLAARHGVCQTTINTGKTQAIGGMSGVVSGKAETAEAAADNHSEPCIPSSPDLSGGSRAMAKPLESPDPRDRPPRMTALKRPASDRVPTRLPSAPCEPARVGETDQRHANLSAERGPPPFRLGPNAVRKPIAALNGHRASRHQERPTSANTGAVY